MARTYRIGEDVQPIADINTTPLVDVMLVLLIMFILIIPVTSHKVPLDLPTGGGATPPAGTGGEFEKQMQQQMEQMVQQISVDPAIGFWLCVLALIAAIVLNNMVRSRRTEP